LAPNYFLILFTHMDGRRMFPRFGTLALIASQVFLVRSSAQSSTCPNDLPSQQKSEIRVIVDAVEFYGENSVSEAERAVLAEDLKKTDFVASSATHDEWAIEVAEVAIRGAFEDKGYFKVFAQSTPPSRSCGRTRTPLRPQVGHRERASIPLGKCTFQK
jgi:hypothetical protein